MSIRYLLLLLLCVLFINPLKGQDTLSVPDTIRLKELKEYPRKNSLPVRSPILLLEPVDLPSDSLELKVNYWRNWISFGVTSTRLPSVTTGAVAVSTHWLWELYSVTKRITPKATKTLSRSSFCNTANRKTKTSWNVKRLTGFSGTTRLAWNFLAPGTFSAHWTSSPSLRKATHLVKTPMAGKCVHYCPALWLRAI